MSNINANDIQHETNMFNWTITSEKYTIKKSEKQFIQLAIAKR